jgi:hypothetical protein
LLLALSLLWVTVGCSDHPTQADEANGHMPTEIAVRYLTAEIQKNIRRQMELATPTLQESLKESTEDQYEYFSPISCSLDQKIRVSWIKIIN